MTDATRPTRASLTLFAFADFGFNLYWQSVMLFLLFYYTDTLGYGIGIAATTYLIASVWDGIVGFAIGLAADRHGKARDYRRALTWGAIPLGLSFILAYLPLGASGHWNLAFLFGAHLLFRTLYAFVNVPYLAMTARISDDSRDRSFVAGARMLSGTLAAIIVSIGTMPIGKAILGSNGDPYFGAALAYAVVASILIITVGRSFRDVRDSVPVTPIPIADVAKSLSRNRSFISLSIAMVAMIVAVTMVSKSVLYYFKYFIHDEAAGRLALAEMMATGLLAIPMWMALSRAIGVRRIWIIAVGACIALLAIFIMFDLERAGAMQLFLIALQAAFIGLNFAVWALLPDTVDFGEEETGKRVEATVFGLASLLQRIAIGLATGILGWGFQRAGFRPNADLSSATLTEIRGVMSIIPILMFVISGLAIASAPGLDRKSRA